MVKFKEKNKCFLKMLSSDSALQGVVLFEAHYANV